MRTTTTIMDSSAASALLYTILLLSLLNLAQPIMAAPFPVNTPLQKRIPAATYEAGAFVVSAAGTPVVVLDNGVQFSFQIADSNFVVYENDIAKWDSGVTQPGCTPPNTCTLAFQDDGNLVSYYNGVPTWFTGTGGGAGHWLTFFDVEPYIVIYDAAYQPLWNTPTPQPAAPPPSDTHGSNPCDNGGLAGCPGGYDSPTAGTWFSYDYGFKA